MKDRGIGQQLKREKDKESLGVENFVIKSKTFVQGKEEEVEGGEVGYCTPYWKEH